jgi:hypothetical protein
MEVANTGDAPVPEARVIFGLAPALPTPSQFFFFEPAGNPPGLPPPSIELGTLEPGAVRRARTIMLLENESPGTVGGSAIVMEGAKGTQHAQATMSFDVQSNAEAPSRALNVEVITEEPSAYADASEDPYSTISIEVHNRSNEAVRDVVVRHVAPSTPDVIWMSRGLVVPGTPPGFQRPPVTEHRTVEWRIPTLPAGESRYFHGLIEKREPISVTHSVLVSGSAGRRDLLAGAVGEWAYAACSLALCDPPERASPTPSVETRSPTPTVALRGGEVADSRSRSWSMIAILGGGGVLFLGLSLGVIAIRRRS